MKFKHLVSIILLSIGLSACNKNIDYSGTYKSDIKEFAVLSFEKVSDNEYKYDSCNPSSGECRNKGIIELKNNNAFRAMSKSFLGKFEGNTFIHKSGTVYKKTK